MQTYDETRSLRDCGEKMDYFIYHNAKIVRLQEESLLQSFFYTKIRVRKQIVCISQEGYVQSFQSIKN